MKLHVLTAVSRPWNLNVVGTSLTMAMRRAPEVEVVWHCRFDLESQHLGGQAVKNELLGEVVDGWVWFLDDDTLVHEDLLATIVSPIRVTPISAVVVSQRRNDGRVLVAKTRNVCVNGIDIGQAILSRHLIGTERIPESYAGDGEFLETLLHDRDDVVYMSDVLSLHNVLSGLDIASRQFA